MVLRVVRQLPDKVEQDHYVAQLAGLLQVSKEALATKLTRGRQTKPARPAGEYPR